MGLRSAAKNFSPIDTVACRVSGPICDLPAAQGLLVRPLLVVA